jgi:hypothetical protein
MQYLSEKIVHIEIVLRGNVRHMWFRTGGEPPTPHEYKVA